MIPPLGGSPYNPVQGTRLLRIVISDGKSFLDPSTVQLNFRLRNIGATGKLRLRGEPITLFKRIRTLVGTEVENLQ